jgi:4-hydroxyphenylacetate 3-monooxygenase
MQRPLPLQARGEWLEKFYTLNDNWLAEDRRKLLAFARDLLNSDYAGHRLTFVQFAQAPHFNHLNAVYNAFDFSGPLDFVKKAAGLSDRVYADTGGGRPADEAVRKRPGH